MKEQLELQFVHDNELKALVTEMPKIKSLVTKAVTNKDPASAGRISSILRNDYGFLYLDTYQLVNEVVPIELSQWEALLLADSAEHYEQRSNL